MTERQLARITDVFRAALERPADERSAFVAETCGSDEALRRNVERLLAGEAEPSLPNLLPEFLESSTIELAPGEKLAQYRIEVKIGEGGMGAVYRAYDTRLHRDVALKVLPPQTFADPDRKGRLVREARAASALNHPNIVTIYEIGSDRGVDFIGMELVSGKTLARLIRRKGLPLDDTLKYAVQMAGALEAAHGAGIVHRDLKPANIMVNDAGQVKVLDFGLAKRTEGGTGEEAGSTQTMEIDTDTGTVVGTVAYMSPEQAERKKLDARSDIFSFGVVLYEMVTGNKAFARDSTAATLAAILKEEPPPPSELAAGLPPDLEKILTRCLRKDPAQRFQHVGDARLFLEDLVPRLNRAGLIAHSQLPAPIHGWRRLPARTAALIAFVLFGGLSLWFIWSQLRPAKSSLTAIPLTSYLGMERHPSFSPDGRQVAFSWSHGKSGSSAIYLKAIGTGPPLQLTSDSAHVDRSPSWSPDGSTVAFVRDLAAEKSAVMLIPALGGPERKLAEICRPGYLPGPYLTWSPDSSALIVSDKEPDSESHALFIVSVRNGNKRRLTDPPAHLAGDSGPAFSPNGRILAFSRSATAFVGDIWLLTVSDKLEPAGVVRRITSGQGSISSPAWTPDGRSIVFSSGTQASANLWRVPVSGYQKPEQLAGVGEDGYDPAISPQGKRLVYSRQQSDINIWHGPGRLGRHYQPVPFIYSTRVDADPDFSPDGSKIAFGSDRSGRDQIWICRSNGTDAMQLTSFEEGASGSPRWSPDGSRVAFDASEKGNWDVYVINAEGGEPRRIADGPALDIVPTWSRDGNWIYFASNRSGQYEVWRVSSRGGIARRITSNGGFIALESADGKHLYYAKDRGAPTSLWKVPVQGGQGVQVFASIRGRGFAVFEGGIYFVMSTAGGLGLQFHSFASNAVTPVMTFSKPIFNGISVSPNEESVLYAQADQWSGDLALVENFR